MPSGETEICWTSEVKGPLARSTGAALTLTDFTICWFRLGYLSQFKVPLFCHIYSAIFLSFYYLLCLFKLIHLDFFSINRNLVSESIDTVCKGVKEPRWVNNTPIPFPSASVMHNSALIRGYCCLRECNRRKLRTQRPKTYLDLHNRQRRQATEKRVSFCQIWGHKSVPHHCVLF